MFQSTKPFQYMLETNFKTGEKSIFAKKNEQIVNEATIIIGDIIHNLRASLDHVYWDCTNAHARSEGERKNIQFPITKNEKALKESILPGLPKRVSESFANALDSLKPYRENGNKFLCAIHDLDVIDKHKLLIPTGNYTQISSTMIQSQVPDFPTGLMSVGFGNCYRDVTWHSKPMSWAQRRKAKIPRTNIIEQELDVPVQIVLDSLSHSRPADDALSDLVSVAYDAKKVLYESIENTP